MLRLVREDDGFDVAKEIGFSDQFFPIIMFNRIIYSSPINFFITIYSKKVTLTKTRSYSNLLQFKNCGCRVWDTLQKLEENMNPVRKLAV